MGHVSRYQPATACGTITRNDGRTPPGNLKPGVRAGFAEVAPAFVANSLRLGGAP